MLDHFLWRSKNKFFFQESNEIKQFYGIFHEVAESAYDFEACKNSSRGPGFHAMYTNSNLSTEVAESDDKACYQF